MKINWDGIERRKDTMQMSQEDRDRFIRMETILENLSKSMTVHVLDDKAAFLKQGADIDFLKRAYFLSMGGFTVLVFILKFVK